MEVIAMNWKRSVLQYAMLCFTMVMLTAVPSFSLDQSELRPTSPPRVPVADYGLHSHRIIDAMYLHYSFEDFTMDGVGIGYNYVNNLDKVGYNLGAGFFYLYGTDDDDTFDINVWNLPLNANLGFRIFGTPETNNLIIFGGIHYTYTWLEVVFDKYDIYVWGPAYGPLFGAKAKIRLNSTVSVVPYYIYQRTSFDYTVEVDGVEYDVDIKPVSSNLLGFDIQFGAFSVGALLDMLNNTDNDKITIIFSYDFDYMPAEQQPAAQETAERRGGS